MDKATKIHLSEAESALIVRTDWILTKREILAKVDKFFGGLSEEFNRVIEKFPEVSAEFQTAARGKISRGENYIGFPYVILDYPACFDRNKIFAIRTMFWWGNFFSLTLHVAGDAYLRKFFISQLATRLNERGFWFCNSTDQWQHHFQNDHYIQLANPEMLESEIIKRGFLKAAKKYSLENIESLPEQLINDFGKILSDVSSSLTGG